MKIRNIEIYNNGYIFCKSIFYMAQDILKNSKYNLKVGTNKLYGDIDSGNWAISYLLSMYKYCPQDFVLFEEPNVLINDTKKISLDDISKYSCYMDKTYPMFSTDTSVKELIEQGLENSKINFSVNDIKELFLLDNNRFERPLQCVGNEIFRAMAAIGFAYDKKIFCFPWLSHMRFESYHENMTVLLEILERLEKIVILPVGQSGDGSMIDKHSSR